MIFFSSCFADIPCYSYDCNCIHLPERAYASITHMTGLVWISAPPCPCDRCAELPILSYLWIGRDVSAGWRVTGDAAGGDGGGSGAAARWTVGTGETRAGGLRCRRPAALISAPGALPARRRRPADPGNAAHPHRHRPLPTHQTTHSIHIRLHTAYTSDHCRIQRTVIFFWGGGTSFGWGDLTYSHFQLSPRIWSTFLKLLNFDIYFLFYVYFLYFFSHLDGAKQATLCPCGEPWP